MSNGEIGHVKSLHFAISALAFLSTGRVIVSVGLDGKCNVTAFADQGQRGPSIVLYSWHVSKPATSLAVALQNTPASLEDAPPDQDKGEIGLDDQSISLANAVRGQVMAVGLENGDVRLYSITGVLIAKHSFGSLQVRGLEWVDTGAGGTDPGPSSSFHQPSPSISQISIPKVRKSSSSSRRVVSTRRTRARPPIIPPRPSPKKGGKLAQRQAERASQDSEGSGSPSATALQDAKAPSKGRVIVIKTHSKGSTSDSSQSLSQPSLESYHTGAASTAVEDQSNQIEPATAASSDMQDSASATTMTPHGTRPSQRSLQLPGRTAKKPSQPPHTNIAIETGGSGGLRSLSPGTIRSTGFVDGRYRQPKGSHCSMLPGCTGDARPSAQEGSDLSVFGRHETSRSTESAVAADCAKGVHGPSHSMMPADPTTIPTLLKGVLEDEFARFQARIMHELQEHREWVGRTLQEHKHTIQKLCEDERGWERRQI